MKGNGHNPTHAELLAQIEQVANLYGDIKTVVEQHAEQDQVEHEQLNRKLEVVGRSVSVHAADASEVKRMCDDLKAMVGANDAKFEEAMANQRAILSRLAAVHSLILAQNQ